MFFQLDLISATTGNSRSANADETLILSPSVQNSNHSDLQILFLRRGFPSVSNKASYSTFGREALFCWYFRKRKLRENKAQEAVRFPGLYRISRFRPWHLAGGFPAGVVADADISDSSQHPY